jgi:hypothetical protein
MGQAHEVHRNCSVILHIMVLTGSRYCSVGCIWVWTYTLHNIW